MNPMTHRQLAEALNPLILRLANKGWIASTAIRPGRLSIVYSELGKERIRTLRSIFIEELEAALSPDQFQALMTLLLSFDNTLGSGAIDFADRSPED